MSRDTLSDLTITNTEEFEEALTAVVEEAVVEGVDVRGAWAFQTRGSTHNWEVEIVELAEERGEDEESRE